MGWHRETLSSGGTEQSKKILTLWRSQQTRCQEMVVVEIQLLYTATHRYKFLPEGPLQQATGDALQRGAYNLVKYLWKLDIFIYLLIFGDLRQLYIEMHDLQGLH